MSARPWDAPYISSRAQTFSLRCETARGTIYRGIPGASYVYMLAIGYGFPSEA